MCELKNLTAFADIADALMKDDIYKGIYDADKFNRAYVTLYSIYLQVLDEGKPVLLLILTPESKSSVSFHGGVYKDYRGKGYKFCREALQEIRRKSPETKFWTKTSTENKQSMAFLKLLGAKPFYTMENADLDNDLIFYRWV